MTRSSPPRIKFSNWVPWTGRAALKRSDGPWLGLYLWARFDHPPAPLSKPYPRLPKQIIYVGESKHLDVRPLTGEHHRLVHYRETFPDDPGLERLYVSVCRIHHFQNGYEGDDARPLYARLRVYTQYIEARLYWNYTEHWGHPPALHYKKGTRATGAR